MEASEQYTKNKEAKIKKRININEATKTVKGK